jgi:hypothetical protein
MIGKMKKRLIRTASNQEAVDFIIDFLKTHDSELEAQVAHKIEYFEVTLKRAFDSGELDNDNIEDYLYSPTMDYSKINIDDFSDSDAIEKVVKDSISSNPKQIRNIISDTVLKSYPLSKAISQKFYNSKRQSSNYWTTDLLDEADEDIIFNDSSLTALVQKLIKDL